MSSECIYLDNHATTPVDPRVLEAMLPYFREQFGNPASAHMYGWEAKEAVDRARAAIAAAIGADPKEIVFTSGATESNNLAIRGVVEHPRTQGRHIVSVVTEHRAVLDPLRRLQRRGYEVTLLPVEKAGSDLAGWVSPDAVAKAIRADTVLVSVMMANNEIGTIQPVKEIGQICRQHDVLFHCDAAQALGKLPVNVDELNIDLLSWSGHKFYGPKGIGGLFVRRRRRMVHLEPLISGGGHELGLRSGTLNVPAIVGMAHALQLSLQQMEQEQQQIAALRNRLFQKLQEAIDGVTLNGPALRSDVRLAGNLNVQIAGVDAESLLLSAQQIAASTGSACSSADPEPSHVLRAIGLTADQARASIRFGVGRFNTQEQIDQAVEILADAVRRLRSMGGLFAH